MYTAVFITGFTTSKLLAVIKLVTKIYAAMIGNISVKRKLIRDYGTMSTKSARFISVH